MTMNKPKYFNNKQLTRPQVRNRRDADKLIEASHKCATLMTMTILHNKFGFGATRLERFAEYYADLLDGYNRGYVSVDDLNKDLEEETGVKVL